MSVFLCPSPCSLLLQRKVGFWLLDDWWNGFPAGRASWEVMAEGWRRHWEIPTCQFTRECSVHWKPSSSRGSPLKPVSVKVRSPRKPFHLSFQALLDLYLLESIEESDKHAIVSFADFVITPSGCAHKCSSMFVTCVFCAKSFVIQENRFLEIFKIKTSLSFSQNSTQFIIF